MSGNERDFNNIETRAIIKFLFLQGKAPKEFTPFRNKHWWNMHHRKAPSKAVWFSLKVVIFPRVKRHVLDDPKQ
jgi:hypothetical protein